MELLDEELVGWRTVASSSTSPPRGYLRVSLRARVIPLHRGHQARRHWPTAYLLGLHHRLHRGGEARRIGIGADEVRKSTTQGATWLVSHPEHRDVSLRGGNTNTKQRDAGLCPQFSSYQLSVTAKCPSCDED